MVVVVVVICVFLDARRLIPEITCHRVEIMVNCSGSTSVSPSLIKSTTPYTSAFLLCDRTQFPVRDQEIPR